MKLPRTLRLALVPIGVLIASKGLQVLSDEAERLGREIDARRAALRFVDTGQTEPQCDDCEREGLAHCYGTAADPWAELEEPPRRPVRRDVGRLVAAAVGFGVGAYLATRAHRALRDRAAAELAAPMADDLPEPAPGTCGVFPAFADPPTPCTLAPHESYRHSWEGGRGDLAENAAPPTPIGHVIDYPCPDDCPCKKYK